MKITQKQFKSYISKKYFGKDTKGQIDYQILESLYSLHKIVINFIELDDNVRDRILQAIVKEQKIYQNRFIEIPANNIMVGKWKRYGAIEDHLKEI